MPRSEALQGWVWWLGMFHFSADPPLPSRSPACGRRFDGCLLRWRRGILQIVKLLHCEISKSLNQMVDVFA